MLVGPTHALGSYSKWHPGHGAREKDLNSLLVLRGSNTESNRLSLQQRMLAAQENVAQAEAPLDVDPVVAHPTSDSIEGGLD